MAGSNRGSPIPQYRIRLAEAYLYEARVRRSARRRPASSAKPTLKTSLAEWSVEDDGHTILVTIDAEVRMPYRGGASDLVLNASTLGQFRSPDAIEEDAAAAFAGSEAVVLLFPYLRAMVGEIGRLTGLGVPPLPTLDVVEFLEQQTAIPPRATDSGAPAKRARPSKKATAALKAK